MLRHRTAFEKRALLRDGVTPSAYGFACGYVQRCEVDASNRVVLEYQHNVFHLKGFENGKHFWVSHRFIRDARAAFREISQRLRLAKVRK